MDDRIALTSGRYDPASPGHIITLMRLSKRFTHLKVVILQQDTRRYPVCLSLQLLKEALERYENVTFFVNHTNFKDITKEELRAFGDFNVYMAGNVDVAKNIERFGVPVEWHDRSYPYSASKISLDEK